MRRQALLSLSAFALSAAVLLPACDDDKVSNGGPGPVDSGVVKDSGNDKPDTGTPKDGGTDSGKPDSGLVPCLDSRSDLPRAPSGVLPCDMLPPDLGK